MYNKVPLGQQKGEAVREGRDVCVGSAFNSS